MLRNDNLPKIGKDISSPADLAGDLRSRVFRRQRDVAHDIGISRSMISKYEAGKNTPPIGYLAFLAKRIVEQDAYEFYGDESIAASVAAQTDLVQLLNDLRRIYAAFYPGVPRIRNWEHLSRIADAFSEQVRQRLAHQSNDQDFVEDDITGAISEIPSWDDEEIGGVSPAAFNANASPYIAPETKTDSRTADYTRTSEELIDPAVTGPLSGAFPTAPMGSKAQQSPITQRGHASTSNLERTSGQSLLHMPRSTRIALLIVALGVSAGLLVSVVYLLSPSALPQATPTATSAVPQISPENTRITSTAVTAVMPTETLKDVLDELWLDSRQPTGSGTAYYVRGIIPIPNRQWVTVRIAGTFSAWSKDWWKSSCKGSPEAQPQYPTAQSGGRDPNGPVGLDPEYTFAAPSGSGAYCGRRDEPPYASFTPLQVSMNNGTSWIDPSPIDAAYSADHVYKYELMGEGFPLQAKLVDYDPSNDYGRLRITIISASQTHP